MPERELYDEVARLFAESLNVGILSPDADLFENGILDSLTFVDLVLHLEQQFDIHIAADDLELENFRSVEKIAAFVAAHGSLKKVGAA